MNAAFQTPILFLVFNRPDTTAKVLERIVEQHPRDLYVAADGPRAGKAYETERCLATRALFDRLPSDITVHRLFREENLGCRKAVSSAISWFFTHVDAGIILEDDCLPDPSFFGFCEAGLRHYAKENRIQIISGQNPRVSSASSTDAVLSRYPHIWGWATWKRAWQGYDPDLNEWPSGAAIKNIERWLHSRHAVTFWSRYFDSIKNGLDTWDVQLNYLMYRNHALAAVASTNLIRNIGFFTDATHTTNPDDSRQFLEVIPVKGPPRFPEAIIPDEQFDAWLVRNHYYKEDITVLGRLKGLARIPYHWLKDRAGR
jgi:hypothetical protein